MNSTNEGMATVYRSSGFNAEMESEMILGLLQSSGVDAMIKGLDTLPGAHEVEVMVSEDQQEKAKKLIAQAQQDGPAAAMEAELDSEGLPER